MLAAAERLRRREDFAATIKAGRRVARGGIVVHLAMRTSTNLEDLDNPARARGDEPPARAGFVVSKAVGGAVVRNKVKRRLRHLVRSHLADLPAGTDLVVRALPSASGRSFVELDADLSHAISAASRTRKPAR